jgi:hypothetical protein
MASTLTSTNFSIRCRVSSSSSSLALPTLPPASLIPSSMPRVRTLQKLEPSSQTSAASSPTGAPLGTTPSTHLDHPRHPRGHQGARTGRRVPVFPFPRRCLHRGRWEARVARRLFRGKHPQPLDGASGIEEYGTPGSSPVFPSLLNWSVVPGEGSRGVKCKASAVLEQHSGY